MPDWINASGTVVVGIVMSATPGFVAADRPCIRKSKLSPSELVARKSAALVALVETVCDMAPEAAVTVKAPATLAPVPVTTNTLALPPTEVLTLPSATGIEMFDVPLATPLVPTVAQVRTPEPLVCRNWPEVPPVIVTLPTALRLVVPLTAREVRVPVEVMLG